jgi:hypothetical protein
MALRPKTRKRQVTLVTTEVFTPYRANEVFTVDEDLARKLLNINKTDNFGRQFYPKVRLFEKGKDEHLELANGTLNQEEHNKLLKRLHPELVDDSDNDEDYEDEDFGDDDGSLTEFAQTARGRGRPKGSRNKS